jgi:hypothetical protein
MTSEKIMNIKVFTISADQVDQLEKKLNDLFQRPDFHDFKVAASFPTSDFKTVVVILQK